MFIWRQGMSGISRAAFRATEEYFRENRPVITLSLWQWRMPIIHHSGPVSYCQCPLDRADSASLVLSWSQHVVFTIHHLLASSKMRHQQSLQLATLDTHFQELFHLAMRSSFLAHRKTADLESNNRQQMVQANEETTPWWLRDRYRADVVSIQWIILAICGPALVSTWGGLVERPIGP